MSKQPALQLRASEQVFFERKQIILRQGKISAWPAFLTITSERIFIEKQSRYAMMFGLIGMLLASLFPSEPISIERSQVTAAERVKFGINDQGIALKLQDGTTQTILVKPHFTAVAEAMQKIGLSVKPFAA